MARPFRFPEDTFAYSNNLYYDYHPNADGTTTVKRRDGEDQPDYSRHCYAMTRSTVQFFRFAEFRPDLPRLNDDEYGQRIRTLCRIPPWSKAPAQKIVFPGYSDLNSFSRAHTLLLQENLGIWWPSYLRLGNWRIIEPEPRSGQAHLAAWLKQRIDDRQVQTVYITRLRPINHCLVVYGYELAPTGDIKFSVYDCNQPGKLVHLTYRASNRSFFLDKTWYYSAGLVNVLSLYVSPVF